MRRDWLFNPVFIYRNRERIVPYLNDRRDQLTRLVKLRPFKDRHRGERCFIVGNGPSLTISDLEKLKSEVTFAANKIYLAFDRTDWRPSYYVVEDEHMARQHHREICQLKGSVKFVSDEWKLLYRKSSDVILYPRYSLSRDEFPQFSKDATQVVYCGYMVTYASLQLAYFMGFTSVYLMGVDFDYPSVRSAIEPSSNISHQQDHFVRNYFQPGETRNPPELELAERAMVCAREFFESHGRKIWNATRGGKLEVFDRISLEGALGD